MESKQKYQEEIAVKLSEWQSGIAALQSKSNKVTPLNLLEFERQLDLLFAKQNLAEEKLMRLQKAGQVEWEELKASLHGICNEIENAIDSAWAKIE